MIHFVFFCLIFGCFLFLGHLLMVGILPRSSRFWKTTDYLWLAIASLGLLGAAQRYMYEVNRELTDTFRSVVERRINLIRSSMQSTLDAEKYTILIGEANNLVQRNLSPRVKLTH